MATKPNNPHMEELVQERTKHIAARPSADRWERFPGRIGVVLSGGGARGAYEAGVLTAFADAQMPTHIIACTSVGSINAASYAGYTETHVGEPQKLLESWAEVTPTAVGIDWSRYILVLGGLVVASAGFGNLMLEWLNEKGVYVHLLMPKITWFMLGITGIMLMLFYDQLTYLGYVSAIWLRNRQWHPDAGKFRKSLLANAVVWCCVAMLLTLAHLHRSVSEVIENDSEAVLLTFAGLALFAALFWVWRARLNLFSHKFLRLPMRTGLFPNYDRTRYLRECIPEEGLMRSPIRVAMTSTDVMSGGVQCFTNARTEELLKDPGVNAEYVRNETMYAGDPRDEGSKDEQGKDAMLRAVIASSAFPLVYETVPLGKDQWTDGGIVGNQPIRPAIKLGADMLFLVLVEPRAQKRNDVRTFLDLGVRALDILMAQNLKSDLRSLNTVNGQCERYAREMGLRPEQVMLEMGTRHYRYMKAIMVEPTQELTATVLDFDGEIVAPAILQGYRDGMAAVDEFTAYLVDLPTNLHQVKVKLVPEELTNDRAVSGP